MSTVEELLAEEEAVQQQGSVLAAELARLTAEAGDGVVRVRVDLNGKPVGIELTHQAMRLTADQLAERIRALAGQAASAVLRAGLERVHRDCGAVVADVVAEESGALEQPPAPTAPAPVASAPAPPSAPPRPAFDDDDDDEPLFEYQPRSDW